MKKIFMNWSMIDYCFAVDRFKMLFFFNTKLFLLLTQSILILLKHTRGNIEIENKVIFLKIKTIDSGCVIWSWLVHTIPHIKNYFQRLPYYITHRYGHMREKYHDKSINKIFKWVFMIDYGNQCWMGMRKRTPVGTYGGARVGISALWPIWL